MKRGWPGVRPDRHRLYNPAMPDVISSTAPATSGRLSLAISTATLFAVSYTALMCLGCKDVEKMLIKDVTNDPSYGDFSTTVGTWKTKSLLTLQEIDKKLYLSTDSERYRQTTRNLATLPVGTEIRVEHLINDRTAESGERLYGTGCIASGPYAGKSLELDPELFAPNVYLRTTSSPTSPVTSAEKQWSVAPDKLAK
jgi:hypothetical protein